MMKEIAIQLLAASLSGLGFALLFGLQLRHTFFAALGSLLAWAVYLAVHSAVPSVFIPNLCASAFAVSYSEVLARLRKCPATLFLVPTIIPLVPGSSLYYAMENAVNGDYETARAFGHKTLICALAIAAGISLVTAYRDIRTRATENR